jgi:hypothetical protein
MAVPVPSISSCVLNHHNLFYQIQNALAFNRDTCCHLALCLWLLPFHWLNTHLKITKSNVQPQSQTLTLGPNGSVPNFVYINPCVTLNKSVLSCTQVCQSLCYCVCPWQSSHYCHVFGIIFCPKKCLKLSMTDNYSATTLGSTTHSRKIMSIITLNKKDLFVTLSITPAECVVFTFCFAKCLYAECFYAKCLYAKCLYAKCLYAECLYTECLYT